MPVLVSSARVYIQNVFSKRFYGSTSISGEDEVKVSFKTTRLVAGSWTVQPIGIKVDYSPRLKRDERLKPTETNKTLKMIAYNT
jgi:hypothetical protein